MVIFLLLGTIHEELGGMIRINRSFIIVFSVFLVLLFGISYIQYEIFHLVASISAIFFGFLIYILTINSTISTKNTLLLTIATVYLYVGLLDFTHAISYDGLNFVFTSANESAQLWVASRFLEATGFLIALTICRSNVKCFSSLIQLVFILILAASIYAITYLDIPILHTVTNGYSIYHMIAISIIIFMFLLSIINLFMMDAHITSFGRAMMFVLLLKIASEAMYGYFNNMSELFNVARYLVRLVSYGGLYMLVVKEVLQNPQQSIYNKFAKKHNELLRLSQIDQLTKIYNHKTSFLKIEEFLDKHRKDQQVYLAMIDIDDFKEVNDTYGHQFGDKILAKLSKVLYRMDLGNNDRVVGRYGGDEFVVAGYVDDKRDVPIGFKKFSERIAQEFKDVDIPITCSVGLVFCNEKDTVKDLVYKADIKMYESKQKGKNQITFEDAR